MADLEIRKIQDSCVKDNNGVPSKIKDAVWLFTEANSDVAESDKVGKWILFLDCTSPNEAGLTKLDCVWPVVAKLVADGHLLTAKASTAFQLEQADGFICCYTPNFMDKVNVKLAAEKIRAVVDYPLAMYYKANFSSLSRAYKKEFASINMYRHTPDGSFYERNESGHWQLI